MALTQIDFNDAEEKIIKKQCILHNLNKAKAIRKIIRDFDSMENNLENGKDKQK